jgi:hypothetical protein
MSTRLQSSRLKGVVKAVSGEHRRLQNASVPAGVISEALISITKELRVEQVLELHSSKPCTGLTVLGGCTHRLQEVVTFSTAQYRATGEHITHAYHQFLQARI